MKTLKLLIVVASAAAALAVGLGAHAGGERTAQATPTVLSVGG